jgi:endonuclease/exonuclease/phosphatase family metal-dependent hydrolase
MFHTVGAFVRRSLIGTAVAFGATLAMSATAAAQSTVVLNQGGPTVTDTTIRAGAYENTNYDGQPLLTRKSASTEPEWERRAILKFDTKNTIPQGSVIVSATLKLTVRAGLGSGTRPIQAFRVKVPFQEADATWRMRQGTSYWSTPGGDIGGQFGAGNAPATAGSTFTFDLTELVQRTVNGEFDSRYTRVLLTDGGAAGKDSYREYYSSEESTVSRRPTLTVVLASTGTSTPPPPTSSGSTLRVLQWNIAQGIGQDGKSNIDRVVNYIATWRPDVISFNEIMHYSSTTSSQVVQIAEKLRAKTGLTWRYKWVQKGGSSSGEGECVMTHLDVDATDEYLLSYTRSVAMIRTNVNGRIVNVFSTHLDHTSSAYRLTQVRQLVAWADNHSEQRIVAGDFNWYPGTTEINEMGKTYRDGWAVAVAQNDDVAYPDNPDGNTRNSRIDYVWFSRGATATSVLKAQVYDTRDSTGKKPSDHNPLMVTFQIN